MSQSSSALSLLALVQKLLATLKEKEGLLAEAAPNVEGLSVPLLKQALINCRQHEAFLHIVLVRPRLLLIDYVKLYYNVHCLTDMLQVGGFV